MRETRAIKLGNVTIGGGSPVSIQTMSNIPTDRVEENLALTQRARALGCDIMRLAVPTASVLPAFGQFCAQSPLPVVADIHFDYRLALGAMDQGAHGIRVNPGNLHGEEHIREVARAARANGTVVRIGVNGGSLDPQVAKRLGRGSDALVESALAFIDIFEQEGCTALKVSLKSSSVLTSIDAARRFAAKSDIPLHLGVTEAGPVSVGLVKSSIGLGVLLLEGIGETIRVSLTDTPEEEVKAARRILAACGLRPWLPEIVSCPTCGRTKINLPALVKAVENEVTKIQAEGQIIDLKKIAIMGCEVNGPGEASDADLGIAGGRGQGILFKHGVKIKTLPEDELLPAFLDELRAHCHPMD